RPTSGRGQRRLRGGEGALREVEKGDGRALERGRTSRFVKEPAHIASVAVVYVHADGRRVSGSIWVGPPEQVDEVEARCSVGLAGLESEVYRIAGGDTLQALLLALRFLATRLTAFE